MKERECGQGFRVESFRPKGQYYPPLDGTGDTTFVRGKQKAYTLLPLAVSGVRGWPVNKSRVGPCGVFEAKLITGVSRSKRAKPCSPYKGKLQGYFW